MCKSVPQIPLAITWIINCPGPGSGTSRSRTEISFGLWITTLFITVLLNFVIHIQTVEMTLNTMQDWLKIRSFPAVPSGFLSV